MPRSWWDLGESYGQRGRELALYQITCAFCSERGNWRVVNHVEKKKPNGSKVLNYDTIQCGNCSNYALVFWSAGDHLHDYKVVPWALKLDSFPEHWDANVGRYWLQAHRSLGDENWDAAVVMARSALQVILRLKGAVGANLKQEILDLATKGELPPLFKEWAEEVRELGNSSAHPSPGTREPTPQDARDIVKFLDYLVEYLFNLPHSIATYRARKERK